MDSSQRTQEGQWFKLNEAAHMLGISEITLRRKIKSGKIQHRFFQGKYYVHIQNPMTPANTGYLKEMMDNKDKRIQELQRQVEDQITLIDTLESLIGGVGK